MTLPTDPYNFTNGSTADAEQVDARFSPLYAALSAGGLDSAALASEAWTAWTPTITTIGGASNTVTARSMKIGRTVHAHLGITFGASGLLTGTDVTITAPYTAANTADQVGTAYGYDASAPGYAVGIVKITKNTTMMRVRLSWVGTVNAPAALALGASTPWTWAVGDELTLAIVYEATS